jgi:phage terminase large subunit-like protein
MEGAGGEMRSDRIPGKEIKKFHLVEDRSSARSPKKKGSFCLLCGSQVRVDRKLTKITRATD